MINNIQGLTHEQVEKSFQLHGDNSLKKEKKKTFIKRFFENLADPIIRILLIALAVQLIFNIRNINYLEMGGVVVAILLSTIVSTISEYRSERAFEQMRDEADSRVNVLRDGKIVQVYESEIVVGDIVYLSVGEKIPADGEIINGKIFVDQSALNGESAECVKRCGSDDKFDLSSEFKVFRGSIITNGSAIMRVQRIGTNTYYGMVAKDVQTETRVSPLKLRLGQLANQISKIGYIISGFVGLTYIFNTVFVDNNFDSDKVLQFLSQPHNIISTLSGAITLMMTVIVVAVPEGLPMMITVVLSANMKRMLADNILVKKLVGIETAGSMNILFTDKTGTLTVGKPECERLVTYNGSYRSLSTLKKSGEIYRLLNLSAKINTDVIKRGDRIIGGNATDISIYNFFSDDTDYNVDIEAKTSFSSEKKYSSVAFKNGIILIKGAAEIILSRCKYAINEKGERFQFDVSSVKKEYSEAANKGERVICVAVGEKGNNELAFLSLIVMKDKIRFGVTDSVKRVLEAGIQVVMITGDSKETASAIAEECGIYNPRAGHIVISSDEFHKMNDDEVKNILPKLRVVSRALPQDKTRLVRISQELDMVVGMTGDGINDAPSLKLSDIGFSMGSGTDIAKSASDIIILDNSFMAIAKTILYGRTIFKSIRKFITFQLTMNIAACGVSLIGQFIGVDTPITIIQMLWINIIMDTLGGLAFAGEPPLGYYMKEKPKSRDEKILSSEMLNQILFSGFYTLALCTVYLTSPVIRQMYGSFAPTDKFYTGFYSLFIFSGLFNCFCARSSRLWILSQISRNKTFILIMIFISIIQLIMIYFGGVVFRCVPISLSEVGFTILLSSTVVPIELIRRTFYKLK